MSAADFTLLCYMVAIQFWPILIYKFNVRNCQKQCQKLRNVSETVDHTKQSLEFTENGVKNKKQ